MNIGYLSKVRKEKLRFWGLAVVMVTLVGWCFYHSLISVIALFPFIFVAYRIAKRNWRTQREAQLGKEFHSFLQSLGASLAVGNSMDGGFREAVAEFQTYHPQDSVLSPYLTRIITGRAMKKPLDQLVQEMAEQTQVKEMLLFASVFSYANQCGGDFRELIIRTVSSIQQRQQLNQAIENVLTAKKMELKIMAVTPLCILLYISQANPGYLNPLYKNPLGVLIMTVCLFVYALAVYWGTRIISIRW